MAQAFMSFLTLFRDRLFQPQGKLATIWFDEIVLHLPRADHIHGVLDKLVADGHMKATTADELLKIWTPIQSVLPQYSFVSNNPWETDNAKLKETVLKVMTDTTSKNYPDVEKASYPFQREVALGGAGMLEGITAWCALNAAEGACAMLPDEAEASIIDQVFTAPLRVEGVEAFSAVATARVPNLESLSWERVLDLRNHPQLEKFREKMTMLEAEVRRGANRLAAEIVSEIELSDLRRMARLAKPSVKSAIIRAIASNVPLPIPVNPASVALGVKEVVDNVRLEREFGWLYFLMDLSSPNA